MRRPPRVSVVWLSAVSGWRSSRWSTAAWARAATVKRALGSASRIRSQPAQVGGVVVPGGGGEVEVGAGDGGAELGDEFLGGVGVVTEAAAEVSVEAGRVARPVAQLVAGGAVEAGGVDELVPVGSSIRSGWGR